MGVLSYLDVLSCLSCLDVLGTKVNINKRRCQYHIKT